MRKKNISRFWPPKGREGGMKEGLWAGAKCLMKWGGRGELKEFLILWAATSANHHRMWCSVITLCIWSVRALLTKAVNPLAGQGHITERNEGLHGAKLGSVFQIFQITVSSDVTCNHSKTFIMATPLKPTPLFRVPEKGPPAQCGEAGTVQSTLGARPTQRRKKRTRPPPKENHLGNFLATKKNPRPMVDL